MHSEDTVMSTSTLPAVYALRYGSLEPLPESLSLQAGPLSCFWENGELRSLRYGDTMVLARLYAAVRDRNWGTVPVRITLAEQSIAADRFRLVFEAVHEQTTPFDTIHFLWTGTIEGHADGAILFDFEGEAKSSFHRNRIGFCLLHPAKMAGYSVLVEHTSGKKEETVLPGLVDPAQPLLPFADIRTLTFLLPSRERLEMCMEGDAFEMEDQRNWTDASFKTFCTPLALPYPVEVPAGTRVRQRVTIRLLQSAGSTRPEGKTRNRKTTTVTLIRGEESVLPAIGTGHFRPHPRRSLGKNEEKYLRALSLAHLRVDVRFPEDWRKNFAYVADTARRLTVPLSVALYLPEEAREREQALKTLSWEARQADVDIGTWLIYPEREAYNGQPWPEIPAESLKAIAPDARILTGTDTDFLFLNRLHGSVPTVNGVVFQINPQVHAFDNTSLMETPLVYDTVVETARYRARKTEVHISPLALKPRYNPYARVENPPPIPPDPRQKSLFAAAWTVHCLAALTAAGVSSVTLYNAIGDTGMMQGDGVYPLWIPLGWLASVKSGRAVPLISMDPLKAAGLTVGKVTLIANLTADRLTVSVPVSGPIMHVRVLDERSAVEACEEPEFFLLKAGDYRAAGTTLELLPYAVACLREP
jgi:hypothetical protein